MLVLAMALPAVADPEPAGLAGDVDDNGVVDNADLVTLLAVYGTSAPFPNEPDPDGVIDATDFLVATFNFGATLDDVDPNAHSPYFGPIETDPIPALLIYNSTNGHVQLDQTNAPGGVISAFILSSFGSELSAPGDASFPFNDGFSSDYVDLIGDVSGNPFAPSFGGFANNPHGLGFILPPGLNLAGLEATLNGAVYVGSPGTGVRQFAFAIVPEPSTLALLGLGTVLLHRLRCRRAEFT